MHLPWFGLPEGYPLEPPDDPKLWFGGDNPNDGDEKPGWFCDGAP